MPLPAILLGMLVGGSQAVTRNREQQKMAQAERAKEERGLNAALFKSYATDEKGRGQRALSAFGVSSLEDFNDPDRRLGVMNMYGKLASLPDIGDGKVYGSGDNQFVIQPYGYFEGNDRIKTTQYLGQFEQAAANGRLQNYLKGLSPSERAPFLSNITMFANSYWTEQGAIDPRTGTRVAKSVKFENQFSNLAKVMEGNYSNDPNVAGNGYKIPDTSGEAETRVNPDVAGGFETTPPDKVDERNAGEKEIGNQLGYMLPSIYGDKVTLSNLINSQQLSGVKSDSSLETVSNALSSRIMSRVRNMPSAMPIIKDLLSFNRVSDIMVKGYYESVYDSDKAFQAIYNKHVLQGNDQSAVTFFQALSALMPISPYDMPEARDISPTGAEQGRTYETIEQTWNKTATDVLGLKKTEDYGERRDSARRYYSTAQKIQTLLKQSGTSNLDRKLSQLGAVALNIGDTFGLVQSHSKDESFDVSFLGNTYANQSDFLQNATLGSLIDFYTYELAYYRARAFEGNSARLSEQDFRRAKENVSGGMFEPKIVTDLKIQGIVKQAEFDNSFFNLFDETKNTIGVPRTRETSGQIRDALRKLKTLSLIKTKLYADDPLYRAYAPTRRNLKAVPELALDKRFAVELGISEKTRVLQAVDGDGNPVFQGSGGRFFIEDPRTEVYLELDKGDFERITPLGIPSEGNDDKPILPTAPDTIPSDKKSDEKKQSDTEGVPEGAELLYESGGLKYYKLPDGTVMVN